MLLTKFIDLARAVWDALAPTLIGSGVALIYIRGVGWRERLAAYVVGASSGHYVSKGLQELFSWGPFLTDFVGFGVGLFAFVVVGILLDFVRRDGLTLLSEWVRAGGGIRSLITLVQSALTRVPPKGDPK